MLGSVPFRVGVSLGFSSGIQGISELVNTPQAGCRDAARKSSSYKIWLSVHIDVRQLSTPDDTLVGHSILEQRKCRESGKCRESVWGCFILRDALSDRQDAYPTA